MTEGRDTGSNGGGPLDGVFVLDLTHALSGPFCTLLLGDLGARVVKVERPPGDSGRAFAPVVDGEGVFFHAVNRGKECIALDHEHPDDRALLEALIARADVIVENFRPGTMERHGLGYDDLRVLNPDVILASISGYGQTGPDHWEGAYDTVIQGVSGLMSVTGEPGTGPTMVGTTIADYLTGVYMFGAVCAALRGRDQTGEGTHIDVAMHDAVLSVMGAALFQFLGTGEEPVKSGNASALAAPFDVFDTSDGALSLCAADDLSFGRLCEALERPELATDERFGSVADRLAHYDALRPVLAEALAGRTVAEWIEHLQHHGVPCGPVNTVSQAVEDAQTYARNMVLRLGTMRVPGNPIKMRGVDDPDERSRAAAFGEHTDAVRRELGFPERPGH
jgi:CoA:oxalate CoA-transferase